MMGSLKRFLIISCRFRMAWFVEEVSARKAGTTEDQMTITFSTYRDQSFAARVFGAVIKTVRTYAAKRAQRIALGELLRMDQHRLDDLGINQQDVIEALNAAPPAGPHLARRRDVRANAGTSF